MVRLRSAWAVAIALLNIGGALASFGASGIADPDAGAWKWIEDIAAGGRKLSMTLVVLAALVPKSLQFYILMTGSWKHEPVISFDL